MFSFLRKNKQEASAGDSEFYSRAEEESGSARSRRRRKQGKTAEAADPILPEKKRARRRLVGALALVLAAVIGLPMILDSEPKPVADDISIQIPSKDKPLPPAPAAPSAAPGAASAALDKKEEVVEIPPPVATAPAQDEAAPATEDGKAAIAGQPAEAPKTAAVDKSAAPAPAQDGAKADVKREPGSKAEAAEKPNDSRAVAILEGKADANPAKAATDKKSEKIVLQVGAFATQEKIDEVRNKLK
ncbi:MAG TPA: hypothetical protein VEC06_20490, partial [Paucimonas sp.]|nr:hypothetical protein [Paucimonas sp.]